jgi:HK97 family phage major capsid protein
MPALPEGLQRAYSLVEVKGYDEAKRTFTGMATSPNPDRMGDTIDPYGAKFAKSMPLLMYHNSRLPVGEVRFGKATPDGIPFSAQISTVDRAGVVQDRINEAIDSLMAKPPLIRAVSIGFRALDQPEWDKENGGFHFSSIEVLELSMVVIPANADATIDTVKSFDTGLPAPGPKATARVKCLPGASGPPKQKQRTTMARKTIADQIAQWEATRKAKTDEMDTLIAKGLDSGETMDDADAEAHEALEAEVEKIDRQLAVLRKAEKREKEEATRVAGTNTEEASRARAGGEPHSRIVTIERKLAPGVRFARVAMAIAAARGVRSDALDYVKQYFPDDHGVSEFVKTAVGGATTANGQAPLLQYTDIMTEFIDYLRPLTILGKFGGPIPGAQGNYPSLTLVPFNVRVGTQTAGGTASWVGEGKPKPLTKGTFSTATLDFAKLACISVLTKEEVRFPSINSQMKVRNDLTAAIIAKADSDLVDPANLGTASVKPAAITANLVGQVPTGTTAAAFGADLKTLIAAMLSANVQAQSLVLMMSQQQALALSLMRTSLGIRYYSDITMYGGYVEGIPVIVSEAITSVGSPATGMIVALNAKDLFLADDGVVNIDVSDQASLEMSDAPAQDGTTGGGASLVSLFQTNMIALRAEREMNWKLMRSASCGYIAQPAYVPQ